MSIEIDNEEVDRVDISDPVNGSFILQSATSFNWDSTTVMNGSHTLIARVYDVAGNGFATGITVLVAN